MSNMLNVAADLMDGVDDLRVVRDDHGIVADVLWHESNQPVEYLRGMVEVITESMGLSMDNKGVIYDEILRRLSSTRVVGL